MWHIPFKKNVAYTNSLTLALENIIFYYLAADRTRLESQTFLSLRIGKQCSTTSRKQGDWTL
jgi:hypothetical protein